MSDLSDRTASNLNSYAWWTRCNTPISEALMGMAAIAKALKYQPLITILVPVFNPSAQFLREAIESVRSQAYPYWELCLADDASTAPHVRLILEKYAADDPRIKVAFRAENGHISHCSNTALEMAQGEYIALLDHDDLLAPEALYEVALLLNQHPEADMIYSDEDQITAEGIRKNPFFKPEWCPDTFLAKMYTCHLGVYRRSLITELGGFRIGFEGSQDYDLVLRLTEKTDRIFHIPKILYHWRIHNESVTSGHEAKPYAYIAAEKAIAAALERRGEAGVVSGVPKHEGHYRIRYFIPNLQLVSIIIPTRDLGELVDQCLTSIFSKTTYPHYEVILIDNGSTEAHTQEVINKWLSAEPQRFQSYPLKIPFNYSAINNYGVTKAKGNFLLFLNNDTKVITPDWIESLVEQAQRPSVGAVGALLLYGDNTIQHAGVVMWTGFVADHSHKDCSSSAPGYFGQIIDISNVSAVTGACLMCRREIFEEVGGFNETELKIACNDIDLCLKFIERGLRNIYLPHVKLYHYESKSRGKDTTPEKRDRFLKEAEYMFARWKPFMPADPCYSRHLNHRNADYRVLAIHEQPETAYGELASYLRASRQELDQLRPELEDVRREWGDAVGRIAAMESSKFWQLRQRWFNLKRSLGLPTEE
jgi:O-antigen biosynthesis protein